MIGFVLRFPWKICNYVTLQGLIILLLLKTFVRKCIRKAFTICMEFINVYRPYSHRAQFAYVNTRFRQVLNNSLRDTYVWMPLVLKVNRPRSGPTTSTLTSKDNRSSCGILSYPLHSGQFAHLCMRWIGSLILCFIASYV